MPSRSRAFRHDVITPRSFNPLPQHQLTPFDREQLSDFLGLFAACLVHRGGTHELENARTLRLACITLRQRAPADLKDIPLDGRVTIPVGGTIRTVKAVATVKVSLDTKDPAEAKRRHRETDAALHEFWQRFRQGPQPLTNKQFQALAGILYARLVGMMDSEPGGRHLESGPAAKQGQRGGLDRWFGPTVDELFVERGVNTDPLTNRRVHAAFKAIQLAAETNLRKPEATIHPMRRRSGSQLGSRGR
ncbi:DUF6538 domain-containing protein [Mesorhizobium sp. M1216]|uniref:DUF6538 domain-containing protein n=1 Tax=Mesorhizobium sp. M1216 TaxID=2957069 RepID=UPI0033360067